MGRVHHMPLQTICGRLFFAVFGAALGCEPSAGREQTNPRTNAAYAVKRDTTMILTIRSSAFANQGRIPKRFTGDGEDVSPELSWSGVPAEAKELALICDDPDAPTPQPWVHWIIYQIGAATTGLREHIPTTGSLSDPVGALQGVNSWSEIGYRGPAPPRGHGVHHYHFKLYALDSALSLAPGADKKSLLAAMDGHVIAQSEWVGTYER